MRRRPRPRALHCDKVPAAAWLQVPWPRSVAARGTLLLSLPQIPSMWGLRASPNVAVGGLGIVSAPTLLDRGYDACAAQFLGCCACARLPTCPWLTAGLGAELVAGCYQLASLATIFV